MHGETPPHPRVIEARSIYARALAVTGDLVRGIAMLEAALADSRTLLGPKNLHAGMLVQNLVGYRLDVGELELADANAAEALAILAEYFAPDSMNYAMLVHTRAHDPARAAPCRHGAGPGDAGGRGRSTG